MPVKQIIIKLFCIKMMYLRQKCDNEEKSKLHYFNTVYASQVLNRIKIHPVLYSLWILFDTYQIGIFFHITLMFSISLLYANQQNF